jgi:hypothetical protein
MNDPTFELLRQFRSQVPEPDNEQRRRAFIRATNARHPRRRRAVRVFGMPISRRYAALGGLLAVLAVLATPAFGVIHRVRDLFEGTPATPLVEQHFSKWNEIGVKPPAPPPDNWNAPVVDTSKAHGVLSVQTSDGPLYLWAAPTGDGRDCWLLQFKRDGNPNNTVYGPSGCRGTRPAADSEIDWSDFINESHPSLRILVGQAFSHATSVVVDLADQSTVKLPVVESFFLATIAPDATVTKITSYDSKGTQLAESTRD